VGFLGGIALLFALGWWLLITTEGVYLGRRVVIWLYDLYASRYERIKGYEPALESRFLGRPIMSRLAPNTAPLVLDAASGTGRLPQTLLRQPAFNGRIIATDLSRRMLHYGVHRLAEDMHFGRVVLMHTPAEKLPFPNDLFDLVTCLEALEFMMQPRRVVAELVRVVRPGGWLLLTNRRGMDARLMPGKTWTSEQALHIYREEFGLLAVEINAWQFDYDLVWAQKPGTSAPTRARALEEIWLCAGCQQAALQAQASAYACTKCGRRVAVGRDGIIELHRS